MDYEIEIPFGAYDSELMHQEIYIPEGFEATIDGNKIILKKIESENERIRGAIIDHLKDNNLTEWATWLEKQRQEPKKVSIWKHWKDGICGNGEGKLIYLIKNGDDYSLSSSLGYECDYILLSDLDNLMLEKQGEQKFPIEKFREGEWVVFNDKHGSVYQIEKIENFQYTLRHILGGSMPLSFSNEDMIRLWTIQDAKGGDVLAAHECYVIFKEIDGLNIKCYCTYHYMNNPSFHVDTLHNKDAFHPATKEQRDLLFQKMEEAGYEWDENNKMLKEIVEDEEEPQNYKNQVMSEITDLVKHYIRQKPVWSEEDDGMFDTMEGWLDTLCEYLNDSSSECIPNVESCINWFKSLKERFLPQPKQDWTEEDEHRAEDTIYFLDTAKKHYASTVELDACIDWLKAIKDRYSWKPSSELDETSYQVGIKRVLENPESYGLTKYNWKPSDEQMNALSVAVKHGQTDDPDALKKLLEQLKKLKGE